MKQFNLQAGSAAAAANIVQAPNSKPSWPAFALPASMRRDPRANLLTCCPAPASQFRPPSDPIRASRQPERREYNTRGRHLTV